MRILVISRNAWDNTNAIGNTLSNFFEGIDDLEFASVYFREANPANDLCTRYYRVTETEVLKKWFVPKKIGKEFVWQGGAPLSKINPAQKNEKKIIRFVRTHQFRLAYKVSDRIWYTQKWLNHNFRNFIEEFQPDLMVTFAKSAPQYYLTVKFLKENYHIPLFSWIADDEYTMLLREKNERAIQNLKYLIDESDAVCGCSQEICNYYNAVFSCQATPLYKSCDFSEAVKERPNHPMKIVYAGNLLYGRMAIVKEIADALEEYCGSCEKVSFDVYSNTALSAEETSFFQKKNRTRYMGRQDYQTIKKRLAEADLVLHTESFDAEQIVQTKYSFSTKIIDCLQSGSVLLAVGPKELASISYASMIPGAYVIDNLDNLQDNLEKILNSKNQLPERARQIRCFAQKHHDRAFNAKNLKTIFEKVVRGEE